MALGCVTWAVALIVTNFPFEPKRWGKWDAEAGILKANIIPGHLVGQITWSDSRANRRSEPWTLAFTKFTWHQTPYWKWRQQLPHRVAWTVQTPFSIFRLRSRSRLVLDLRSDHQKSRQRGYLGFYRQTRNLRRIPMFTFSCGTVRRFS